MSTTAPAGGPNAGPDAGATAGDAPTVAGEPLGSGPDRADQRTRILDTALTLVSELGVAGTSMRRLASACGLNVATIYHYFPSKASLMQAVIEERRYGERMAVEDPPLPPTLAPLERLAALIRWVTDRTLEEEMVLRMLVGEGMRGDPTARRSATELLAALDETLAGWLDDGFPELRARGTDPRLVARLVRRCLLAIMIEHLATGSADIEAYADELASTVFG